MKILIAALLLLLTASAGFAIGRSTESNAAAPRETRPQDVTGRPGDVFRFPALALFCTVSFEIDQAMLLCNHTGDRPRHQVVFYRDRTTVGRMGYPGNQRVFPEEP